VKSGVFPHLMDAVIAKAAARYGISVESLAVAASNAGVRRPSKVRRQREDEHV
jgi:hypothetical protein